MIMNQLLQGIIIFKNLYIFDIKKLINDAINSLLKEIPMLNSKDKS